VKNKNGLDYFLQSNSKWKDETMTFPEWQKEPDTWGLYGCLGTSSLNIYNDFFKDDVTPTILNENLKKEFGYNYLYYKNLYKNNMKAVYEACYLSESKLRWDVLARLLKIKIFIREWNGLIDLRPTNEYFLIKVPYKKTGHWCFIVSCANKKLDSIKYFDVYDGFVKKPVNVLEIIKIIF
jgi:hypothetical protein